MELDTQSIYKQLKANNTENRIDAELMEAAMSDHSWAFEPGSGCRAKMQFYADCIRDGFDTAEWPATTTWEKVLQ